MSLSSLHVYPGQVLSAGGTKNQTGYGVTPQAGPGAVMTGVATLEADTGVPGPGEDPAQVAYGFHDDPAASWIVGRDVWVAEDATLDQAPDFTTCSAWRRFGVAVTPTRLLIGGQFNIPRAAAGPRPLMIGDDAPHPHQATDAELVALAGDLAPALGLILSQDPTQPGQAALVALDDDTVEVRLMTSDGLLKTLATFGG